MKRAFLILLIIILVCVLCNIIYICGYNNGCQINNKFEPNTSASKVDYPLIDISFYEDSDWMVVVRHNLFTKHEVFYVSQDVQNLQLNKDKMVLSTYPVGRGTTPVGIVYIYKDGCLIKEVPYIEILYEDNVLKKTFVRMAKDDIEKHIKNPLPLPI